MNSHPIEDHLVSADTKERLSDYAVGRFESLPSRKSVKKAIKRGLLLVNGQESNTGYWVQEGDVLSVIADETIRPVYERDIPVLYEDDHIAAVQKPGDLPVSGNSFRTLQNALTYNLKPSTKMDALSVPRPVHRLDRQTSGVVLVAKTLNAANHLGGQFEKREVTKKYLAWVEGEFPKTISLNEPFEAKEAITEVERLQVVEHKRYGIISKVECRPLTGRRNQIRIHLSEAGFPILGDIKFGAKKSGKGLFLFALKIIFAHPFSKENMELSATIPKKFKLS